jgi:hypothetical protein
MCVSVCVRRDVCVLPAYFCVGRCTVGSAPAVVEGGLGQLASPSLAFAHSNVTAWQQECHGLQEYGLLCCWQLQSCSWRGALLMLHMGSGMLPAWSAACTTSS